MYWELKAGCQVCGLLLGSCCLQVSANSKEMQVHIIHLYPPTYIHLPVSFSSCLSLYNFTKQNILLSDSNPAPHGSFWPLPLFAWKHPFQQWPYCLPSIYSIAQPQYLRTIVPELLASNGKERYQWKHSAHVQFPCLWSCISHLFSEVHTSFPFHRCNLPGRGSQGKRAHQSSLDTQELGRE